MSSMSDPIAETLRLLSAELREQRTTLQRIEATLQSLKVLQGESIELQTADHDNFSERMHRAEGRIYDLERVQARRAGSMHDGGE